MNPERVPLIIDDIPIPSELQQLWTRFGGGEAFESEYFLLPVDGPEGIRAATSLEVGRGMASNGLIFHSGYCLSLFLPNHTYLSLTRDGYELLGTFDSLDDWYVSVLRHEFGLRYGMPS